MKLLNGFIRWKFLSQIRLLLLAITLSSLSELSWADTVEGACMQDISGFNLTCTANDVAISGIAKNPDGTDKLEILDDGCAFLGDTVTFTATFELNVNSKERHDVGIYFVTDGDIDNDGAISGACSLSPLPYAPDLPWLDLDGTNDPFPGTNTPSGVQDTCGDIDKPGHNPLEPTITLTAVCKDDDNDGFLNLPNCTSWRQSGANELCTSPLDAFPGSPSKCRCDDAFNVPIEVPPAELLVVKTANQVLIQEPGDVVTFSVSVTNIGVDPDNFVNLNDLTDSIYGDITSTGHDGISATTCSLPQNIPVDDGNIGGIDTYSCEFTVFVAGNAGDIETDIVTAIGTDSRGNNISGSDDETITITDVLPDITVLKIANPTELLEPGGNVSFSVTVTNSSLASSDLLTINSLIDNIHGDLNGQGDCVIPQIINVGASYNCSFSVIITGNAGHSETDIVTASGTDDEGNVVNGSDSATVVINNVVSMIQLVKVADPVSVDEPGGNVTFSFSIHNSSVVDTVTINSLTDSIYGDLNGQGDCSVPQILLPDASYVCTVMIYVAGDAASSETNIATASGIDDDGEPLSASDDATVNFNNVPPAASLTKSALSALVSYQVTVTNDSDSEALTLDALVDDKFGNITQVQGAIQATTCSVPQVLATNSSTGDTYVCTFNAVVDTSPHTNTVTGAVNDNDGSAATTPSDSSTVILD